MTEEELVFWAAYYEVKNEREKLEIMAKSLGINYENKTISELRQIISSQMGNNNNNSDDKIKDDRFKN